MATDDANWKYDTGPLGPKSTTPGIGGTHLVSVKVDPDKARTGQAAQIPGDVGHPADGGQPYCPSN